LIQPSAVGFAIIFPFLVQFVDLTSGAPWETLRLTTLGRDSEFFESFLNHARDSAASAQEGCTVIYTSWGTGKSCPLHPIASGQSHCVYLHAHAGSLLSQ
jgi:hypothetical protein